MQMRLGILHDSAYTSPSAGRKSKTGTDLLSDLRLDFSIDESGIIRYDALYDQIPKISKSCNVSGGVVFLFIRIMAVSMILKGNQK